MSSNYINVLYRGYVCEVYSKWCRINSKKKIKFCAANPTMLDVKFTSSLMKEWWEMNAFVKLWHNDNY